MVIKSLRGDLTGKIVTAIPNTRGGNLRSSRRRDMKW